MEKLSKKKRALSTDIPDSLELVPIPSSTRSKAGKKAKRKGSVFERSLCKSFSDFWGSKFFRTPMSGGSHLRHDYNLAGDVSTPDELFPYHVEAKNQQALKGFYTIFTSAKCPVWKWWQQCVADCPKEKIPLLIFTKNYMPEFILVPRLYGTILEAQGLGNGNGRKYNLYGEFMVVKDCAMMTLKRFLGFKKGVHLKAAEEYSKWGNSYEIRTTTVSGKLLEQKFYKTPR